MQWAPISEDLCHGVGRLHHIWNAQRIGHPGPRDTGPIAGGLHERSLIWRVIRPTRQTGLQLRCFAIIPNMAVTERAGFPVFGEHWRSSGSFVLESQSWPFAIWAALATRRAWGWHRGMLVSRQSGPFEPLRSTWLVTSSARSPEVLSQVQSWLSCVPLDRLGIHLTLPPGGLLQWSMEWLEPRGWLALWRDSYGWLCGFFLLEKKYWGWVQPW